MTQHPAPAAVDDRPHRGIGHLLHPQVLGVIVGSSGASAFVHVNRGLLPGVWSTRRGPGLGARARGLRVGRPVPAPPAA